MPDYVDMLKRQFPLRPQFTTADKKDLREFLSAKTTQKLLATLLHDYTDMAEAIANRPLITEEDRLAVIKLQGTREGIMIVMDAFIDAHNAQSIEEDTGDE